MTSSVTKSVLSRVLGHFRQYGGMWAAILASFLLKLMLELSGVISFNSDEGVMTVMSRHILRGEIPIFHYGQAYMGTVENFVMALNFVLFGQSVFTARIGVIIMYSVFVVGTTFILAYRITSDRFTATVAAFIVGIPPVMITVYTSTSLGAWIAVLLLQNLIFWLGWDILSGRKTKTGWWFLAGFVAGVGWWELPIIAASVIPLTIQGFIRFRGNIPWKNLGLAALAFLVGTSPWLIALVTQTRFIVGDMIGVRLTAAASGDPVTSSIGARLLSAFFFNIPALFGLRPSWSIEWIFLPMGIIIIAFYIAVFVHAVRVARSPREPEFTRMAYTSLLGAWVVIMAVFLPSPFAIDPSGRYIMLLYPPAAIMAADFLGRLESGRIRLPFKALWLPVSAVMLIVTYNLFGNLRSAMWDPPGITTQFAEIARIPHDYDDDLIAFLDEIEVDRGYSNFWVTFRFAFLTGERIILAPALPYHEDLSFTYRDNKYPPYREMADAADDVVFVTSNHPALDDAIKQRLTEQGIGFEMQAIGPYTVFYDFPYHIEPEDLGPFGEVTGHEIYNR